MRSIVNRYADLGTSGQKLTSARGGWIAILLLGFVLLFCVVRPAHAQSLELHSALTRLPGGNVLPTSPPHPRRPYCTSTATAPSHYPASHPYAGSIQLVEYEQRAALVTTSDFIGQHSVRQQLLTRLSFVRHRLDHPLRQLERNLFAPVDKIANKSSGSRPSCSIGCPFTLHAHASRNWSRTAVVCSNPNGSNVEVIGHGPLTTSTRPGVAQLREHSAA